MSGGASDIIRVDNREPRTTKARNRHRSPKVKPTRPDTDSHSQARGGASTGSASPRTSQPSSASSPTARTSRTRLTVSEPMRRPAASNASAVATQQKAVPSAASCPA